MRRFLLWSLAGLALLLLAAPLALQMALERGALTATLDAALERAAGRPVALGRIVAASVAEAIIRSALRLIDAEQAKSKKRVA